MKLRHIILFVAAAFVVGCKPADKTADAPATPAATTSGSTAATTPDSSAAPAATTADDSSASIVGTWTMAEKDAPTVEFKEDKTFTMSGPSGMKDVTMDAAGTYELHGDKMNVKWTSMKMTAGDSVDEKTKATVETTNKGMDKLIAEQNKDTEQDFKMVDKDTFTTTDKHKKVTTFKRKAA